MDLVRIDTQLPIKAYPAEELNRIILMEFTPWISSLLSLTDEISADRLEVALPAIKEHCWSMGFAEVKKMFEMYADNKLSITPLPNYFDRVLFGKIVTAYKLQKPTKKIIPKEEEIPQEEKDVIVFMGIMNCFDHYKEYLEIPTGYSYAYDFFYEKGKLPEHNQAFRKSIKKRAETELKKSLEGGEITTQAKNRIKEFREGYGIRVKCKEIVLRDYFDALLKNNIDIKTQLV